MFTPREKEVLELLLQGKTIKQISSELNISTHTINAHVEHIYSKTNSHSRIELLLKQLNMK